MANLLTHFKQVFQENSFPEEKFCIVVGMLSPVKMCLISHFHGIEGHLTMKLKYQDVMNMFLTLIVRSIRATGV